MNLFNNVHLISILFISCFHISDVFYKARLYEDGRNAVVACVFLFSIYLIQSVLPACNNNIFSDVI